MQQIANFTIDGYILKNILTRALKKHSSSSVLYLKEDKIQFSGNYPNFLITIQKDVINDYILKTSPMEFKLNYTDYVKTLPKKLGTKIPISIIGEGSIGKLSIQNNKVDYTMELHTPRITSNSLTPIEDPTTEIVVRDVDLLNNLFKMHFYDFTIKATDTTLTLGGRNNYATLPLDKKGENIYCDIGGGRELSRIKPKSAYIIFRFKPTDSIANMTFIEDEVVYIYQFSTYNITL